MNKSSATVRKPNPDVRGVASSSQSGQATRKTLKFTNYDFIGIDLDHTIARYNLENLFHAHHEFMVHYLKRHKHGYRRLSQRMTDEEIDFLSRGLFIDPERGNILKATESGTIVRASHGLQGLPEDAIIRAYGLQKKWKPINNFIRNKIESWSNGALSGTRAMLDFTDLVVCLVFAKAVSSKTKQKHTTWSDVMDSVVAMYNPNSSYSDRFREDKPYFVHKLDGKVKEWLKALRKHSRVALITSAHAGSAKTTMEQALGPDYQNCFDIFIYDACKPWFFLETRPFFNLAGEQARFNSRGEYTRGCSFHIESHLSRELERNPRLLYIGDSPINDLIAPSMDVVAIVEELAAEGIFSCTHPHHSNYITSSFWGSYLYEDKTPTVFGDVIFEQTIFAAPCLDFFTDYPTDHEFTPFWIERQEPRPSGSNA